MKKHMAKNIDLFFNYRVYTHIALGWKLDMVGTADLSTLCILRHFNAVAEVIFFTFLVPYYKDTICVIDLISDYIPYFSRTSTFNTEIQCSEYL